MATDNKKKVHYVDNKKFLAAIVERKELLKEAEEVYEGTTIKYNFKTQRGFISMAKNEGEDSRYQGEKVKKVDKDVYFVEDGIYTP